jgi:hypothetical protein
MMANSKQTIYVTLSNGTVIKEKVPKLMEDSNIIFILNSKYGEQGWISYKIRIQNQNHLHYNHQ